MYYYITILISSLLYYLKLDLYLQLKSIIHPHSYAYIVFHSSHIWIRLAIFIKCIVDIFPISFDLEKWSVRAGKRLSSFSVVISLITSICIFKSIFFFIWKCLPELGAGHQNPEGSFGKFNYLNDASRSCN